MFATGLIDISVIDYLKDIKQFHTPAILSNGIPNAGAFQPFFDRLSENFMQACQTLENAQFAVSTVKPSEIVGRFNKIIQEFDHTYRSMPNPFREILKQNVITTKNQLNAYADEIAPFALVPFINGTIHETWTLDHRNDFQNVRVGKKLADYLKHVNGLIGSIQKSIGRSRDKIQHGQLKRLGTKILNSVEKFEDLVGVTDEISSSLTEITNAIDGLRNSNNGFFFNRMKINARKILDDLNQLKLLMEKQWTDMDSIFRTRESPQQLPTVTLAN